MNDNRGLTRLTTAALLTVGVAVAGLGLGAAPAHADHLRWCPGDPPPKSILPAPGGGWVMGTGNPAWDTSVCHDYTPADNGVQEGIGCPLPTFQAFQCPPGTMPNAQLPFIPNK